MELSIIVPVYNEEECIKDLISSVRKAFLGIDFELIIVDDKSTDNTLKKVIEMKDTALKIISLSKNYGQSAAIKAGIEYSSGNIIGIIDGDLQNEPSDLLSAFQLLKQQNVDMVQGYRKNRHDKFAKVLVSYLANRFIKLLFHNRLNDIGCAIKVIQKSKLQELPYFKGFHRYIALLAHIKRFTIIELEVLHNPRKTGVSKYGMERLFPVLRDLIIMKKNINMLSKSIDYSIETVC